MQYEFSKLDTIIASMEDGISVSIIETSTDGLPSSTALAAEVKKFDFACCRQYRHAPLMKRR
ncbi:hypothetical protein MKQ70_32530 [Chitinophaga sedimenti]|uniref:hypothetical protein n=1 Tax=Chitinophaga sedimenti TaxID=2033606 RepID=UPI002006BD40|nr:hypothetical protein [Chitinophaga sedimenti]MCK7559443.1 hypothetical protein [Chitinophaga sedimenti]